VPDQNKPTVRPLRIGQLRDDIRAALEAQIPFHARLGRREDSG
jgi:hypothetical protein